MPINSVNCSVGSMWFRKYKYKYNHVNCISKAP